MISKRGQEVRLRTRLKAPGLSMLISCKKQGQLLIGQLDAIF
jgi:hypothetical protein